MTDLRAMSWPERLKWAVENDLGGAKLEAGTVRAIRAMFSAGTSNREISDHFAVPHKTVGNITSGRTWKHV